MEEGRMLLTDAAKTLGIPYQTVYAAWSRGRIPYTRMGGFILVRLDDVRSAMKNHRPRGTKTPVMRTA